METSCRRCLPAPNQSLVKEKRPTNYIPIKRPCYPSFMSPNWVLMFNFTLKGVYNVGFNNY